MAVPALAPRGFALTAFGDILQNVVLRAATIALFVNVRSAAAKSRLFWALMGTGLAMWLGSQVMWTYVEVYLRHEAPSAVQSRVNAMDSSVHRWQEYPPPDFCPTPAGRHPEAIHFLEIREEDSPLAHVAVTHCGEHEPMTATADSGHSVQQPNL